MQAINAKRVTLDGKALPLKIINQLMPLPLEEEGFECLGYYNIKGIKTYIFSNGNELKKFIDRKWGLAKSNARELVGPKNRFRSFKNTEDRDRYYSLYTNTVGKLNEEQLFY